MNTYIAVPKRLLNPHGECLVVCDYEDSDVNPVDNWAPFEAAWGAMGEKQRAIPGVRVDRATLDSLKSSAE